MSRVHPIRHFYIFVAIGVVAWVTAELFFLSFMRSLAVILRHAGAVRICWFLSAILVCFFVVSLFAIVYFSFIHTQQLQQLTIFSFSYRQPETNRVATLLSQIVVLSIVLSLVAAIHFGYFVLLNTLHNAQDERLNDSRTA